MQTYASTGKLQGRSDSNVADWFVPFLSAFPSRRGRRTLRTTCDIIGLYSKFEVELGMGKVCSIDTHISRFRGPMVRLLSAKLIQKWWRKARIALMRWNSGIAVIRRLTVANVFKRRLVSAPIDINTPALVSAYFLVSTVNQAETSKASSLSSRLPSRLSPVFGRNEL